MQKQRKVTEAPLLFFFERKRPQRFPPIRDLGIFGCPFSARIPTNLNSIIITSFHTGFSFWFCSAPALL
ncbi:unnamed protein product, partial [Linum tenue]